MSNNTDSGLTLGQEIEKLSDIRHDTSDIVECKDTSHIQSLPFIGNVDKYIFWPSLLSLIGILLFILIGAESSSVVLTKLQSYFSVYWSWFILLIVGINFFFAMYIALSRYGKIVLGRDGDKPEYSFFVWLCMLFSTGVGIGFICFGVAEPMWHLFTSTHNVQAGIAGTPAGVPNAIQISIMDWGASCWALFAIGGLAIGLPCYRKGLPMCVGTSLYGLLGDDVYKSKWSKLADIIGIIASVCGNSAALGMGILSICWVVNRIFDIEITLTTQALFTLGIFLAYILSTATGLNKGIKYLSMANVYVGMALCVFVLIVGPTTYILNNFTQQVGLSFTQFLHFSFFTDSGNIIQDEWLHWWPIFYWLWWVSYIPFVGGFVARISRGRTLRQFLCGVSIAPVAMSLVWFTIFGSAGAFAEFVDKIPIFATMQAEGSEPAIYLLLESYPFGTIASLVALLSLIIFTVTTSDSASFYISLQVSGLCDGQAVLPARVIWGTILGLFAVSIIFLGGKDAMTALKGVTIAGAAPFCVILVLMQVSLWKMLKQIDAGTL